MNRKHVSVSGVNVLMLVMAHPMHPLHPERLEKQREGRRGERKWRVPMLHVARAYVRDVRDVWRGVR